MLTVSQVKLLLCLNDWLATMDLMEAYWHVPIHPRMQKFLVFCIDDSKFQFSRIPFGLLLAPRASSPE